MINQNLLLAGDDAYNLTKSLRFRSSASAYLNRTPASAGTSNTKMTFSAWVKRGTLGASLQGLITGSTTDGIQFWNDNIDVYFNGGTYRITSPSVYRDPAAWYHIVVAIDTTQATAANRVFIYVNNVLVTSTTGTPPPQNYTFNMNQAISQRLARDGGTAYFDGYMTEVNDIDGQQLTPSSFGETDVLTGVWKPKRYAGTYGTNGFYLPFTNTASTTALGYDFSGNSNNWTTNNISISSNSTYDSMADVPTLTSATTANYAVWSPLVLFPSTTNQATMSNGNLLMTRSAGGLGGAVTTIATTSGKFYAEMPVTAVGSSVTRLGVVSSNNPSSMNSGGEYTLGDTATSIAYRSNGARLTNGTTTNSWGDTYTTGDVIGVAFDADTGKIWFAKNNTWQASGDPSAGTNPAVTIATGEPFYFSAGGESGISISLNCGQQGFTYTPPTGFVALNTYNLPTSTIVKGNTVMDATLYTGNGSSPRSVTGLNFQPDLVWGKNRTDTWAHQLFDAVRGAGSSKGLASNDTNAEGTYGTYGYISSFNSDGYTLTAGGTSNDQLNKNTNAYVGWAWKANGAGSTNTNGSITSTVSVNATAGFSIVTYTGTGSVGTIGHGLGVKPSMIMFKVRSNGTYGWYVYNSVIGATNHLVLNTTAASSSSSFLFNDTAPTSSVMTVGTSAGTNQSGQTYVAYCWAEVAGFSKFGSYTGNGSTDGPFVYLGFRPKFVMFKASSTTSHWTIIDTSCSPYNVTTVGLEPDSSSAETTGIGSYDFLSNGFKCRNSVANEANVSGQTYIYAAFAENPFKNALAR